MTKVLNCDHGGLKRVLEMLKCNSKYSLKMAKVGFESEAVWLKKSTRSWLRPEDMFIILGDELVLNVHMCCAGCFIQSKIKAVLFFSLFSRMWTASSRSPSPGPAWPQTKLNPQTASLQRVSSDLPRLRLNAETSAGNMVQSVLTRCALLFQKQSVRQGSLRVCVRAAAAPTCYLCPNAETLCTSLVPCCIAQ